jgi:hypothetical protein
MTLSPRREFGADPREFLAAFARFARFLEVFGVLICGSYQKTSTSPPGEDSFHLTVTTAASGHGQRSHDERDTPAAEIRMRVTRDQRDKMIHRVRQPRDNARPDSRRRQPNGGHLEWNSMQTRRILAIFWTVGAFLLMLWCWTTYSGPYLWAAEWQMAHFGSYQVKLTLFGPLIVLLLPAGFLAGWGPLLPAVAMSPAAKRANARRNARVIALLGVAALAIGLAGGLLGYQRMRKPPTSAELRLTTGAEVTPHADLVTITAIARPDLSVGYEETVAGTASRWSFVPLVAPDWKPGQPVRFILRTNQTAWMPPAGADGPRMPRMLSRGNPPFQMTTAPSVLSRFTLPGVVKAEYEKARIPLDPSVAVVEQSAGEMYAPYWMTAAGGALVGLCLLLGGLIGLVNAGKVARA